MSKKAVMVGLGETHLNVRFVKGLIGMFPALTSFVMESNDFHGFKKECGETGTDVLVSFSVDSGPVHKYHLYVVFTTVREGLNGPYCTETTFTTTINDDEARAISELLRTMMDDTLFIGMKLRSFGEDYAQQFFEGHFKNTIDTGTIATFGFNIIRTGEYLHDNAVDDHLFVAVIE